MQDAQVVTTDELTLVYMLQSKTLTAKALALRVKDVKLFDKVRTPHLSFLWDAYFKELLKLKAAWRETSKSLLLANMAERVLRSTLPDIMKDRCNLVLSKAESTDITPAQEDEGRILLKRAVGLDTNRKFLASINNNEDLQKLQQQLDASKRAIEEIGTEEAEQRREDAFRILPLQSVEKLMRSRERIPLGINFLDRLSNGGGRTKEVWAILGPSGGGKTMLTVQLAVAQMLMGNYCVWATYEQSMEGDLTERMVANVTGGGLSALRDKSFSELPEAVKTQYRAKTAGLSEKLITYDMTKADPLHDDDPMYDRGVRAIWDSVKKEKAAGRNIKIVLIDWLGELVMMLCGDKQLDPDRQYRHIAQQQISLAKQMAEEEDLLVIFWHQLSTQAQTARPTSKPTKGDAYNMKSLAYNMDAMFALGTRDKHDVAYFLAVKSRKGDVKEAIVQMEGEKARFADVHGWVPNRDGDFYKPGEDINADEYDSALDQREDAAASYKREV